MVEHRQVLDELAQPDASGMRVDDHAELGGEQQIGDVLVHARDPAGVDLHDVDRAVLKQLFEDDPVRHVLPRCHPYRGYPLAYARQSQDVVGVGRLLDPGDVELREKPDAVDRLVDVPDLVGVEGKADVIADRFAGEIAAAAVVLGAGAYLQLHKTEARGHRVGTQRHEPLVVVTKPACRRRVRGVPVQLEASDTSVRSGRPAPEKLERLVTVQRVAQVAKVDERNDLFGGQVGEDPPERRSLALRAQIPHRIYHRADGHVHDALLRAKPAQRAVPDQPPGEVAEIGERLVDVEPDDERLQGADRCELDVVAAPDREREAVPPELVAGIGAHDDVGQRIVGSRVHRVRAGKRARGREPDVVGVECREPRHGTVLTAAMFTRPPLCHR